MPTTDQTLNEILTLAAAHFKMPRESLAPADGFFTTLVIDSLQTLYLLTKLKNHFRVELEDLELDAGGRAGILMTNQSKWLISAYAIFYGGGVLVPLDYKLTAAEQLQLLEHSKAKVLVVEYYLWRAIMQAPEFHNIKTKLVLVTEAPLAAELVGGFRWEDFKRKGVPDFVTRQREDVACIVYSSGTGGRPKGCVLTHENYLEQVRPLPAPLPSRL